MCKTSTLCLCLIVISSSLFAQTSGENDRMSYFSGDYSAYRLNDSTYYNYGRFEITTEKGVKIRAYRLKTINTCAFESDILKGVLLSDGVKITTHETLKDLIEFEAERITYSNDSTTVNLEGEAVFRTDNITVVADRISIVFKKLNLKR